MPPSPPSTNWSAFAESPYPWERDALDFVRERFPSQEPWRAWSLFEFLALDGSVNEVDLLVYAPFGFFLWARIQACFTATPSRRTPSYWKDLSLQREPA